MNSITMIDLDLSGSILEAKDRFCSPWLAWGEVCT